MSIYREQRSRQQKDEDVTPDSFAQSCQPMNIGSFSGELLARVTTLAGAPEPRKELIATTTLAIPLNSS
jgi:hypothetical protein